MADLLDRYDSSLRIANGDPLAIAKYGDAVSLEDRRPAAKFVAAGDKDIEATP